jgi:transcriptional regulator GlxA family with amidase domain
MSLTVWANVAYSAKSVWRPSVIVVPIRIGFLLVRLFPMYVVVLATEALRLANKYMGERRFDWSFISDRGRPVMASNGIRFECDVAPGNAHSLSYAFVVAGDDQSWTLTPALRHWLHRVERTRTILGAIDSGVFLLADCRLIKARRITVHPDAAAALREQYPDVRLAAGSVVRDGSLLTCAGGVATTDLMLMLITEHCSAAVARSVARDMVLNETGELGSGATKEPASDRANHGVDGIARMMERSIEEPLTLDVISGRCGVSRRHITRLFRQSLGRAPMDYYRTLRLNHAKQLLFQSDLSISQIAVASGFQSLSSFSRSFSTEFGSSPRTLLSELRKKGNSELVPSSHQRKQIRLVSGRRAHGAAERSM